MEERVESMNFKVDDHPAYSPDRNPIEHVWIELKKRLQEQYPKIGATPGGKDKVKQRVAEVLLLMLRRVEFVMRTDQY